ncbi:hypothetical protein EYF80_005021 [Liparis tanakae]|uniref:Uncharacterized protein n=1 Tax=Liparis tanakae TaxID=230148 RepID=A0A4Z2J342_9TELE|nr:hypothetical protein EYF80_005021 [Liparis tanakae]
MSCSRKVKCLVIDPVAAAAFLYYRLITWTRLAFGIPLKSWRATEVLMVPEHRRPGREHLLCGENLAHQMPSVSSRENIRRGAAQRGARGREETKQPEEKLTLLQTGIPAMWTRVPRTHRALSEEPIGP